MRILITGANGQIGWELQRALQTSHEVIGVTRSQMELIQPDSIRRVIQEIKPDLIVNAAGYTAVDQAETEPEVVNAVNAHAVGIIGEQARKIGAAVVHFSTDYVFDGTKRTPYRPTDPPNPLSVYGRSKLDGEMALRDSQAAAIILRTAWVYGLRGRNFLLTILRSGMQKPVLRIVNDQTGTPTAASEIAHAVAKIVRTSIAGRSGNRSFGGKEGTYHLTAAGATTWFDFAKCAFEILNPKSRPDLISISSCEYAAPARRPAYSVLENADTQKTFDVLMADWTVALKKLLRSDALTAALAESPSPEKSNESLQPPASARKEGSDHPGRGRGLGAHRPRNRTSG